MSILGNGMNLLLIKCGAMSILGNGMNLVNIGTSMLCRYKAMV